MTQKIIAYIKEEISHEPISDIGLKEDLLGSGIVDSLGIMKLIDFIEKETDTTIPQEDMTVENFMTLERIISYLESSKQS